MAHVLESALKETLEMIPWLFGIHVALELLAKRTENFITAKVSHQHRLAPLLGAIFGCMPQCGFSVIAATLFSRRCISLGTLLAVFLSTSDEAIPIILSQHGKAPLVIWVILTKVAIATLAGYAVDLFCKQPAADQTHPFHAPVVPSVGHQHCSCHKHQGKDTGWKTFLFIPLRHTLRISLFVFLVCLGLNALLQHVGSAGVSRFFFPNSFLQPIICVLVGLIPNCAVSVVLTEVYLKGVISFGSAIAGLCSSAGLGTLVLLKENKNIRENLKIIGLLAGISLCAGLILNFIQRIF